MSKQTIIWYTLYRIQNGSRSPVFHTTNLEDAMGYVSEPDPGVIFRIEVRHPEKKDPQP